MQSPTTAFRGGVHAGPWTNERLDSWKEVASFFRREVRTVQLWEKSEGLPVRRQRHKKLGSVYAYRHELEAWWASRSAVRAGPAEPLIAKEKPRDSLAAPVIEPAGGYRIITVPFEAVLSGLDRGTFRHIVEEFAEGLNNELVIELVQLKYRPVILPCRNAHSPVNATIERMRQMARELGADLFLSGSIRYAGSQVRVSAQLVRASDALCIWSDRFDSELDDVLSTQAELAQRIARALPNLRSSSDFAKDQTLTTEESIAGHACSMGFYYWKKRGRSALAKAITYFRDAIELEPRCADAYAGLADTYVSLSYNHLMPAMKAAAKAREAVDAALKLDKNSIKVRNSLINLFIHCSWNLSAAERECRELFEVGRHDVRTLQLYSSLMNLRGRHDDAIHLALHAYRLAPESDLINGQLSLAYFYAGDYGSALSFIRRTIDLEPQFLMGYALLGRTEAELGNWDEAIKAFQCGLAISPHCAFIKALLAYAFAGSGDVGNTRGILRELEQQSQDECFPAYDVSAVHAILNQESEALKKIHRAYGTRDMKTIFVQHDPRFARLRNLAGFQEITSALHAEANSPAEI